MRGEKRRVDGVSPEHIYQRSFDGGIIFYDVVDFLVFYAILSVYAKKYHITIIGICLMPDHLHILLFVDSKEHLSQFIRDYTSKFSKDYNADCQRKGPVFDPGFGSAMKWGGKKIRTAIAYLYNNPVEKQLTATAIEYRWNLLAYHGNKNPFSKYLAMNRSSLTYRKAAAMVKKLHSEDRLLTYQFLRGTFDALDSEEKNRLTDYIISVYNPIDYERLSGYYGGFDKMLTAINSNTGSEYDLKEDFNRDSDAVFLELHQAVNKLFPQMTPKQIAVLPCERKRGIVYSLSRMTGVNYHQIKRYLHLDIKREKKQGRPVKSGYGVPRYPFGGPTD